MSKLHRDDAYDELTRFLHEGERVESLVFGDWGKSFGDPGIIPDDRRGVLLSLEEATPYMHGWSFSSGFGGQDTYPVTIWTDRRVITVREYDGSTYLFSLPRHPAVRKPVFQ